MEAAGIRDWVSQWCEQQERFDTQTTTLRVNRSKMYMLTSTICGGRTSGRSNSRRQIDIMLWVMQLLVRGTNVR